MENVILQLNHVKKKYHSLVALNDVSFSVNKHEIIGLVGPNGAGKTTALKLIARLLTPNSGTICIKNINGTLQDIHKHSKNLLETGFLIDIPQFYNSNILHLLKYIANIRNYPKDKIDSRINHLLREFTLYKWKYKNIKTLSKGMNQKLGFIASIINEPELIILDEPQTGLDPESRIKIREYLISLQKEGKTILISSHLLNEIREICNRIAILNQGFLVGFDSIDNLERKFKIKQLVCEIEEKIAPERLETLISKIIQNITKYTEQNENEITSSRIITYNPEIPAFIINYDGLRESKSKILETLSHNFKDDFVVSTFYEPKLSQIEKLYSQTAAKDQNKSTEFK
jgi:ABC-2 type transport system ATP-binding protein